MGFKSILTFTRVLRVYDCNFILHHIIKMIKLMFINPPPITVSKETYYSVKRDLFQGQKRPSTPLL